MLEPVTLRPRPVNVFMNIYTYQEVGFGNRKAGLHKQRCFLRSPESHKMRDEVCLTVSHLLISCLCGLNGENMTPY